MYTCTVTVQCTIYTYIVQLRNITGARKLGRLKEAVKMFKDLAKEVRLEKFYIQHPCNVILRFLQS